MLTYYFRLQARRIHRIVSEHGLHPVLNYLVIMTIFVGLSFTLFFRDPRVLYAYVLIGVQAVSIWSNPAHNDFLKITYHRADYYKIRIVENVMTSLPFVLVLGLGGYYLGSLCLISTAFFMAVFRYQVKWQFVLPTPFSKHPFEFTAGFRISFLPLGLAYYLTYISIRHANIGIGIFAILIISVLCALFNIKVENILYVWVHSCDAKRFIFDKLKTATLYTIILCLPIVIALSAANPGMIVTILVFQIVGLCFVYAGVMCKYASFPKDISVRDGFLLFFSILCPPLLLFSLPYFYITSTRQLKWMLT